MDAMHLSLSKKIVMQVQGQTQEREEHFKDQEWGINMIKGPTAENMECALGI